MMPRAKTSRLRLSTTSSLLAFTLLFGAAVVVAGCGSSKDQAAPADGNTNGESTAPDGQKSEGNGTDGKATDGQTTDGEPTDDDNDDDDSGQSTSNKAHFSVAFSGGSNFGRLAVGTTRARRFLVLNSSAEVASISAVEFTGGDMADFSLAPEDCTPPRQLAPHTGCRLSITFAPTRTGGRQVLLRVTVDDGILEGEFTGTGKQSDAVRPPAPPIDPQPRRDDTRSTSETDSTESSETATDGN
jgi:Abnormal spindle-like microcephaly-assoc'd, ASPM-SPD-2-Hydin